MDIIFFVVLFLVVVFSFVLAFGAPYLPTLRNQIEESLDLLDLKKGQTLIELGCGDGRVMVAAAKRGIKSVGYELNPILYAVAKMRSLKYRSLITVKMADYWSVQWPDAEGIYVFLRGSFMKKLDKKVIQYSEQKSSLKLVSFGFEIPNRKPIKQKKGLFLYEYCCTRVEC